MRLFPIEKILYLQHILVLLQLMSTHFFYTSYVTLFICFTVSLFVCARTGIHMHFPTSHCSFVTQFLCLCVHTVILSFYFGRKSKLLRTCGRFNGVKFALWDQEYGGRVSETGSEPRIWWYLCRLDSGVVALVKQIAMHQHSKLFGTAMKWSC